jgi:hypothetical protein
MAVRARLYCGDWIGDCTRSGCAGAEFLFALRSPGNPAGPLNPRDVRRNAFLCTNCLQLDDIEWPEEEFMMAVQQVVSLRPVPQNRNWFPEDHPLALASHVAHGQTIDDLRAENSAHGVPV